MNNKIAKILTLIGILTILIGGCTSKPSHFIFGAIILVLGVIIEIVAVFNE